MGVIDSDNLGVIFDLIRGKGNKVVGFCLSANESYQAKLYCNYLYITRNNPTGRILNCALSNDGIIVKIGNEESVVRPSQCSFRLESQILEEFEKKIRSIRYFEPLFTEDKIIIIFRQDP